jgi:mRNA interferase MazF
VKRGEVWVAAGGGDYTRKPRPVVIVQDDRFEALRSVTVCALTSTPFDTPLLRMALSPSPSNGLQEDCHVMVDKITTVRRERLSRRIGSLSNADMRRIDRAILTFLGIAG